MEPRKLIRLGNSSFAIALPKDWVDKSGLKKGDDVFVERNSNGEIILSSKFKKIGEDKPISLDLKGKDETSLQIDIIGAYLRDYNTFKIKNNIEAIDKKHIKELVKNLMSFEIIEENKEEIILKDLFNLEEADVKSFVRRMDNLVRGFFEDILIAIKNGKISSDLSKEIQIADREITRIYLLISRIYMKSLNNSSLLNSLDTSYAKLFNDWWTALHLEKLGDGLKHISKILEKQVKKDENIIRLFESVYEKYHGCMNSYYGTGEKTAVKDIISDNSKFFSELNNFDAKEIPASAIIAELKELGSGIFQISKMRSYMN